MIFRKPSGSGAPAYDFPGRPEIVDGVSAVLEVVRGASDLVAAGDEWVRAAGDEGRLAGAPGGPVVRPAQDGRALAGVAAGAAAAGLRATALCAGGTLAEMRASLAASSARRLPYVVHHLCTPAGAASSHDALFAVADTGAFQLFARNVQEAADFALIARHAAETALAPGVVVEDLSLNGTALQTIRMPEPGLAERFLGHPADLVASATPAQELIFGARRRRVPRLLDLDAAAGLGAVHDEDTAADVLAGRDVFFHEALPQLVDASMEAFAALTGRRYGRASGYRLDDAEAVVVAQGAVVEGLEAVADYLRARERLRVGVLSLTSIRPFPGALVSRLLQGKKAVTVLEHEGQVLGQDPPLLKEIRGALERAVENGRTRQAPLPHPTFAAYRQAKDTPALLSAVSPGGRTRPAFGDLRALFLNMLAGASAKQRFYVGVHLGGNGSRLPAAERARQQLRAAYPDLDQRVVPADGHVPAAPEGGGAFQIRIGAGWDGGALGRRVARALFRGRVGRIRTAFHGQGHAADGAVYTVAHAPTGLPPEVLCGSVDAVVVSSPALLAGEAALAALGHGGAVLVQTPLTPAELWAALAPGVRGAIRTRGARLHAVDARAAAAGLVDDAQMLPLLAAQALAGAFLATYRPLDGPAREDVRQQYLRQLAEDHPGRPDLVGYLEAAFGAGAEAVRDVAWETIQIEERPVPERPAPWAVRGSTGHDMAAADLVRAWETYGYLHATGRSEEVVIDPLLALGTMPARSSAFRSTEGFAEQRPRLLPENCTACGTCWTWCPEAALPTAVQDVGALLAAAMDACARDGVTMIQLQRVASHLVKQAHRLLADDELSRYLTLDHLLQDAVERLADRMQLREDQRAALMEEFAPVRSRVEGFPIVKTDAFFRDREKAEKGSGLAFALALDPDACKGCGLCARVCPENALEMVTAPAAGRQTLDFLLGLPDTPVAELRTLAPAGVPGPAALPMINRQVYHTLVGGDDSAPGNGARTALHLVLAAAEAVQQERVRALAGRIEALAAGVEELLQCRLNGALRVDAPEQLGRRLAALRQDRVGLPELVRLMDEDGRARTLDVGGVERLTAALGALRALAATYTDRRARMALALGPGPRSRWQHSHPHNPFSAPWIVHLERDAPAVAEGLFEGVMREMVDTFRAIRTAELLLNDTYRAAEHDTFFARFGRHDLTDEEWLACPPLFAVADEHSEQVDALLRGDLPIRVVLLNAQRYDRARPVEPALAAVGYGAAYVLQSTPAFAEHLVRGVEEGLGFRGPALFHLYAPDPAADGTAPEETAELARLAVEGRAFPLFVYDPRRGPELHDRLALDTNPAPDQDWGCREVTVEQPNGLARTAERPVLFADWAARQGRFFGHFTFVPKRDWGERMTPLHQYLALDAAARAGCQPYVEVPGAAGRPVRKVVSDEMVAATEGRLARWRLLLEVAGVRSALAERLRQAARAEMERQLAAATAQLAADHEARLAEQERTHAERYHAALSEQLLALSGYGEGSEEAQRALGALLEEPTETEVPHAGAS